MDAPGVGGRTDFETIAIIAGPVILDVRQPTDLMRYFVLSSFFFILGVLAFVTSNGHAVMQFLVDSDPLLEDLQMFLRYDVSVTVADLHVRLMNLFGFPHHAFLHGLAFGMAFSKRIAFTGAMFWLAQALIFVPLALYFKQDAFGAFVGSLQLWCMVPLYMLGVAASRSILRPTIPRFNILAIMMFVFVIAIAFLFYQYSIDWALRLLTLAVLLALASKTIAGEPVDAPESAVGLILKPKRSSPTR